MMVAFACRLIGLVPTLVCLVALPPAPGKEVDFEAQVAPILIKHCLECHQSPTPSGNLNLTTHHGFLQGGDSGPAVDLDQAEASLLIEYLTAGEMPPPEKGQPRPLAAADIEVLRDWIEQGASWPADRQLDLFEKTTESRAGRDWWSLQKIVEPAVPAHDSRQGMAATVDHPIDAFIESRLRANQLAPAPPADRRTLVRRLYYDLLGLPPTREEMDRFLNDPAPDAWQRLVDDLLERPQYGEHWGRFWLDLVRYADTSGYERDQEKPFAWKYRDWVTSAFNRDMPFDQFVTMQIAGDEISSPTKESVIATGFLRLGTWNDEPNEPLDYQYDRLEDLVHTTASAFLGLTVKCARCHAHKFDPIKQEDYYRFATAFWPGPIAPRDRELLGGPTPAELGFDDVLGWTDVTTRPPDLHMLKNGERDKPLQVIHPGTPTFLAELKWDYPPAADSATTTGRRLQLARWITHPDNPLTPRVIVNRLWQQHFGQALVRTPNNFGFLADPPTHPQLLDWLASEFQRSGGSIKHIHRLILTSATWQQSSLHPDDDRISQIDANNRLLWRFPRRRLSAEALRDTLLSVSGQLDANSGGPSFRPTLSAAALDGLSKKSAAWQASPPHEQHRRTLYCFMKRGLLPPLLTTFDLCDATQSCGKRDVTTVPTQALALLNGEFIHQRSLHLASQILSAHDSPRQQIAAAWSAILARDPTASEIELALAHLQNQAEAVVTNHQAPSDPTSPSPAPKSVTAGLAAGYRVDAELDLDRQTIHSWFDQSDANIKAVAPQAKHEPLLLRQAWNNQPALRFDGEDDYLELQSAPLHSPYCTIVAVARNESQTGHREIISNWRADANVGTSVFLGLTAERTVRFSDAFANAGQIPEPTQPFILIAINEPGHAAVYCNGELLAELPHELPGRRLDTPWVIGQQGNIQGEFWQGDIAEILLYDHPLDAAARQTLELQLATTYGITLRSTPSSSPLRPAPELIPLASLCHVLMNSNEFLYVD